MQQEKVVFNYHEHSSYKNIMKADDWKQVITDLVIWIIIFTEKKTHKYTQHNTPTHTYIHFYTTTRHKSIWKSNTTSCESYEIGTYIPGSRFTRWIANGPVQKVWRVLLTLIWCRQRNLVETETTQKIFDIFFLNFEQLSVFSMNFPNNVTLVQKNCFEENPSTNAFRSQKRTQMFIPSVSRFRFALCRVSLYDQGWKFIKIHLTITFFYGRIPSSAVSGMCRSLS